MKTNNGKYKSLILQTIKKDSENTDPYYESFRRTLLEFLVKKSGRFCHHRFESFIFLNFCWNGFEKKNSNQTFYSIIDFNEKSSVAENSTAHSIQKNLTYHLLKSFLNHWLTCNKKWKEKLNSNILLNTRCL